MDVFYIYLLLNLTIPVLFLYWELHLVAKGVYCKDQRMAFQNAG